MTLKIYILKNYTSEIKPKSPAKRSPKKLANRYDLIISNAEKGGTKVIQDIDIYIQEATRQTGRH